MHKELTVYKNGMVHNENDRNSRECECYGCGKNIPIHIGRKYIIEGTYKYIHRSNNCIELARLKMEALNSQSDYKHQLVFNVNVVTYTPHKSIALVNGIIKAGGRESSLYCHSLNKLRVYRELVSDIKLVEVVVTLPDGNHIDIVVDEIAFTDYQTLLNNIIIDTKIGIYKHYNRLDKVDRLLNSSYKSMSHSNFTQCLERIKAI